LSGEHNAKGIAPYRLLMQLRVLPAVGREAFATHAHTWADAYAQTANRIWVESVVAAEHPANAASYQPASVNQP
jgi:hypothetical protein